MLCTLTLPKLATSRVREVVNTGTANPRIARSAIHTPSHVIDFIGFYDLFIADGNERHSPHMYSYLFLKSLKARFRNRCGNDIIAGTLPRSWIADAVVAVLVMILNSNQYGSRVRFNYSVAVGRIIRRYLDARQSAARLGKHRVRSRHISYRNQRHANMP